MSLALSDYNDIRLYVPDPRAVTVKQKLAGGDLSDSVSYAKRVSQRELSKNFAPASLTSESVGYVIWEVDLTNCTDINPGDEITDGSDVFVVQGVVDQHFDDAKQFMLNCVKKVS